MALDFPSSPTTGATFTSGGVTWRYDGTKWTVAAGGAFLPISGGTLTGPLNLAADPTVNLGAATKQYVDGAASGARWGDNRIINGDMRIDQRNNGAGGTTAGYTVDRWAYGNNTGASRGSWQRTATGAASVVAQAGFQYCLNFTSGGAYTPAATDTIYLYQPIEADAVADFACGTSGAQPVTLSFWVSSNQTGTFSGALAASGGTRSYPFTFSIPVAAAWTKIVLTIPGDTAGTWVMSGNGIGVYVRFDLGSGANFRGPPGAWASANYIGATGAVSIVSIASATFNVTGVKLEIGSVATPFNRQSLAKSMADCQRYYCAIAGPATWWSGNTVASGSYFAPGKFPVTMRGSPTVTLTNLNNSGFAATPGAVSNVTANVFFENRASSATATNSAFFGSSFTADAEL